MAFKSFSCVKVVFDCGLLESKTIPWMAASPDAIAVIDVGDGPVIATVEVKTRVSSDRIKDVYEIAEKYRKANKTTGHDNKIIFCDISDDTFLECIPRDHATQLMVQVSVVSPARMCCYIVGTAGVRNSKGGIIYVVMANVVKTVYWDFNKSLFNAFNKELKAFYTIQSSAQLLEALQFLDLTTEDINILTSRWLFFRQLRCQIVKSQEVNEDMSEHSETFPFGFPPTTMFKSKFQIMYNSLKGGLDANTQQYVSIQHRTSITSHQNSFLDMDAMAKLSFNKRKSSKHYDKLSFDDGDSTDT
jgi:hypothetical protein